MSWLVSLRSRIIVLVAGVTIPSLGALWVASDAHRTEARVSAEAQLSQLAIGTAGEQRRVLMAAQRLVRALTTSTALALSYQEACVFLLNSFTREYEQLHGLQVVGGDEVWCESGDPVMAQVVRDMAQDALAGAKRTREAAAGEPVLVGTAPYLPIVIPFTAYSPDRTQTFEREFIAAVELGGFGTVAAQFSLDEEGGIIVLFDHLGRLLVRHPARDEFLGRVVDQVTLGLQGGFSEVPVVVEGESFDGTRRVHAVMRLDIGPGFDYPLAVVAALPVERIYADATVARRDGILYMAFIALISIGLASILTRWFLRRDIMPLLSVTERISRGDIPDHQEPYAGPRELAQLREAMVAAARTQSASENRLANTLYRLDIYLRNSPMAFLELGADTRIRMWTNQAQKLFGWTEQEAVGKTPRELGMVHPDDISLVEGLLSNLPAGGGYTVYHNRNLTRGGRVIHCEWHNSVLIGESGKIDSLLCIALDETKRIIADEMLARQKEDYRLLFENNPTPMWIHERHSREFLAMNHAASARYGWQESELLGATLNAIGIADEQPDHGSCVIYGVSGNLVDVKLQSDSVSWQGSDARVVVVHDVSSAESTRATLETRIGKLVALVDITVERVMRFPVNLTVLAGEVLADLADRGRVRVVIQEGMDVHADRALLRTALTHLLENAVRYASSREHGSIEVGCTDDGKRRVFHVRDNGIGFDTNSSAKLFELSSWIAKDGAFTGRGVGLVTVSRIVAAHGGAIWLDPSADEGAWIRFTLPEEV